MNNLRWFGLSDRGRIRAQNEDAFLGMVFDAQEAQLLGKVGGAELGAHEFVFAVSDGIGGAAAGEFASRITVEKIKNCFLKPSRRPRRGLRRERPGCCWNFTPRSTLRSRIWAGAMRNAAKWARP